MTGGLSMMIGVLLSVQHGGIFVFPVVTNPAMYLVSIIVAPLVTAFILRAWKKPVNKT